MTALLILIHVLEAIGRGYVCWAEIHVGGWMEWLCQKP